MEALQRVASMIAGPDARADYQFTIPYGQANDGIEVFFVRGGRDDVEDRRRRFIKKKTFKKAEFKFAKLACILQDLFTSKYRISAPIFLHVESIGDAFYIFQEFADGARARPIWSDDMASVIAHSIYQLNIGLDLLFRDHFYETSEVALFGNTLDRKINAIADNYAAQQVNQAAREIEKEIAEHARVICHNDVYWSNFAINTSVEGKITDIKFIDFGMIGTNYVGADLHHFALGSLSLGKKKLFFDSLVKNYAVLAGFPEEIIAAVAFYYAAHRQAMRFIKAEKKKEAFDLLCALLMAAQLALGAASARRHLPRYGG